MCGVRKSAYLGSSQIAVGFSEDVVALNTLKSCVYIGGMDSPLMLLKVRPTYPVYEVNHETKTIMANETRNTLTVLSSASLPVSPGMRKPFIRYTPIKIEITIQMAMFMSRSRIPNERPDRQCSRT